MTLFIGSLVLLIVASLLSLLSTREGAKKFFALGGVIASAIIGLFPALSVIAGKGTLSCSFAGILPGLSFHINIDSLAAFFLIPILGFSALAALYAWGYVKGQQRLLGSLPFFPLLVASMMGVVVAADGFLFLIIWEIMSLTSFFLVTTEHGERQVRHAGWVYLAITHLATAFLFVFFILLFQTTGSFAFRDFVLLRLHPWSGFLFVCAIIGFGTKAGMFPFHLWLPQAHPAAPSYISAVMSGVMIKTGIYGIFRVLTFFGPPPLWWGELLVGLGLFSTVLGILFAVMQHDLKTLLAYSSIENIGLMMMGIGLGVIGMSTQQEALVLLGCGGALFHVWNHTLFKGLLFLGAGNILQATHTRMIDRLGGLLKKMPITGSTFLIASAAICGLPPLNGFLSEWFLYVGFFEGITTLSQLPFFLCVAAVVGTAFAGGLAVLCFTKAFGMTFLGLPRVAWEQPASDGTWHQSVSLSVLALLCVVLGLFPQLVLPTLQRVLVDGGFAASAADAVFPLSALRMINVSFVVLIGCFLGGWFVRSWLLTSKQQRFAPTWGCGFDRVSSRMQYTAASYVEPLGVVFSFLLRPAASTFDMRVEDLSERLIIGPLVRRAVSLFTWIRRRQRNLAQDYLAYIFATLLILLFWEVWLGI